MKFIADKIQLINPQKVKLDPENSRIHTDQQILEIANSIKTFGFLNPILLDKNDKLIAGEGRTDAALLLGLDEIPFIRIDHLSERQRKALAIADNKIALNAGWDFEQLSETISSLVDMEFDVDVLGFDEQEIDSILKDAPSILGNESEIEVRSHKRTSNQKSNSEKKGSITCTCPECGHTWKQ